MERLQAHIFWRSCAVQQWRAYYGSRWAAPVRSHGHLGLSCARLVHQTTTPPPQPGTTKHVQSTSQQLRMVEVSREALCLDRVGPATEEHHLPAINPPQNQCLTKPATGCSASLGEWDL